MMNTLDKFVESGKSSLGMSMSSMMMSNASTSVEVLYDKRLVEIAQNGILEKGECIDLAKICLQRFDPELNFHCDSVNCSKKKIAAKEGEEDDGSDILCPFRYEVCPYEHCGTEYSAIHAQDHDKECPLKPVDCERVCGRVVLRKLMSHHMQDECILRPVRCQYVKLGCEASK